MIESGGNLKKFDMSGFEHARYYARGYIRTSAGAAYVKVSKLQPKTFYEFGISQYCGDHCPLTHGRYPLRLAPQDLKFIL